MKSEIKKYPYDLKYEKNLISLIEYIKTRSRFYSNLYSNLKKDYVFEDLPVIEQSLFWQANTSENNTLLTGPISDGIVFRSGGTTGNPKFTVYSKNEWQQLTKINARAIEQGHLNNGDHIGNLFHAGAMYGSFNFTSKFLEECNLNITHYPIGGHTDYSEITAILKEFKINVLFGGPTTLIRFSDYYLNSSQLKDRLKIEKIFFAGESLYEEQRNKLISIFPKANIYSIGYASNEGGLLGYADKTCRENEHRVFDECTIIEILDENTLAPIQNTEEEGLLVVTNKIRYLMPTIRYPVGDRGMWIEPLGTPNRKFKLLGRSQEGIKIGRLLFYIHDFCTMLDKYEDTFRYVDFQIEVYTKSSINGLCLRIALSKSNTSVEDIEQKLISEFTNMYPLTETMLSNNQLLPFKIEFCNLLDFKTNKRTGKLLKVIDNRR